LLAAAVAAWAGLTALGGLAVNYGMLLATRLGVGIGEAAYAPAATSWIGDLVPAERRARALAGFMMAVPVGIMLSFAVSGPVAQAWGWRSAMAVAAAPAVLLAPALLLLREPPRSGAHEIERPMNRLLRIPALWWIAASGVIVNFTLYTFSTFIAAFLTRYHGLSVAAAGLWAGVGSGVAGVLGAFAVTLWGDRARTGRLYLTAVAAAIAAPLALGGVLAPRGGVAAAIPLLMAAYGLLQMYYGLVYAAIQDIVPAGLRGTAMAGYYLVMYVCGGAFGPLFTGALSDRLARLAAGGTIVTESARAQGLHDAMYIVPVLCVALAAVLWRAGRAAA
jgi:predicted MFS family arabinose efflux permease